MNTIPRAISVMEMYRRFRNNKLMVNRRYQRKLVWTLREKTKLIESILKGYPIPSILLAEQDNDTYEIIDGTQRLNAIFAFIENQFSVSWKGREVYFDTQLSPLANTLVEKGVFTPAVKGDNEFLVNEEISAFLEFQLPIVTFSVQNEEEVNEIFRRINSYGKYLSPQEVRQAGVTTKFANLVRELGSEFRGDVSKDILSLTEMPEISIDSKYLGLGYGVQAEDTFWCKHGILSISQIRDGEDEQFTADLVLSIALDAPFSASKEEFDKYYGKKDTSDKTSEIEMALNRYGVDNLKFDIKLIFSKIKNMVETNLAGAKFKVILNPNAGPNPVKEPFYTFFMASYGLMVKEKKEPFDEIKIFDALRDLASKIKSASHYIKSDDRKKNIGVCKGLIQDYFKSAGKIERSPGTLSLDFETYLRRSRVEAPHYDFKQGLYSLDEKNRKFSDDMLEKIFENMAALANLGKDKEGYLFIGVTDKEEDTEKVKKLDKSEKVPTLGKFGVVGLEREAKLKGCSLDDYISSIVSKIHESALPQWLITQVNTEITPITYRGNTILMIKVKSGKEPAWYKNKLFVRDGASCKEVTGKDIGAVYKLFK